MPLPTYTPRPFTGRTACHVLAALALTCLLTFPTLGQDPAPPKEPEKPKQTFAEEIGKKPFINRSEPQFMFGAKGKKYAKSMADWVIIDHAKRKQDLLDDLDEAMAKAEAMEDSNDKTNRIGQIERSRSNVIQFFLGVALYLERKDDTTEYIRITTDETGIGTKIKAILRGFPNEDTPVVDSELTSKSQKKRHMQFYRREVQFGHNERRYVRADTYMYRSRDKKRNWIVRYEHFMPAARYKKEYKREIHRLSSLLRL